MLSKQPHGEIDAHWQDDALFIKPKGGFNIEGMLAADALVRNLVEQAPSERWARVDVFIDRDSLGPPEGIKHIFFNMRFCKQHGCTLFCLVGGNVLHKENMTRIASEVGLVTEFFSSLDEAMTFLRVRGFMP